MKSDRNRKLLRFSYNWQQFGLKVHTQVLRVQQTTRPVACDGHDRCRSFNAKCPTNTSSRYGHVYCSQANDLVISGLTESWCKAYQECQAVSNRGRPKRSFALPSICSIWVAMASSRASWLWPANNCSPTGIPPASKPTGMVMLHRPSTFPTAVLRNAWTLRGW